MKILNLGCGTKISSSQDVINIDWSIYLRMKKNPLLRMIAPLFLKGQRLERFKNLTDNIMIRDISKGIPFESNSVDAVYHSHFLEHLERDSARVFLQEVKRVLKPGGVHRIVVPDLEYLCRNYFSHISLCEKQASEIAEHDSYIEDILLQSVQKEAYGTSLQRPFRRFMENLLLGDARKRGENHLWMYDRFNLQALLTEIGYHRINVMAYNTSSIPNWQSYGLDTLEDGKPYIINSLYVEALK